MTTANDAAAQSARRRFEPTDLRLQGEGVVELDTQVGIISGEDGVRRYVPDFEASLGISPSVELEVDGSFGLGEDGKPQLLDNTLLALRLAIVDVRDTPHSANAWAGGVQVGPRLPTALGNRGVGAEAIAIVGRTAGKVHLFLQLGALLDPLQAAPGARAARPFGLESGLDLDLDLDDHQRWSVKGELGGVKFLSPDRSQLHLTAGPAVRVVPWLELSLVGVLGFLAGGDRYGALLGAATRFRAF